jgi:hypothetical protein
MRNSINDAGLARIASCLHLAQELQVEQAGESPAEGQITVDRVAEGDNGIVAYFSNGVVSVLLPSGEAQWFDSTNTSGTGSFAGGNAEEQINAAAAAATNWNYENNEALTADDNKWITMAGGSSAADSYGVPSGARM